MALDLEKFRTLEQAATPGPWVVSAEHGYWQIGPAAGNGWATNTLEINARSNGLADHDAVFVAELRNVAPELLAEIEKLRAAIKVIEDDRDYVRSRMLALEAEKRLRIASIDFGEES